MDYLIEIVNVESLTPDSQRWLTLVYSLTGTIVLQQERHSRKLSPGQGAVVNRGEHCQLSGRGNNCLLTISINHDYFSKSYHKYHQGWFTLSRGRTHSGSANALVQLNTLFEKIARCWAGNRLDDYELELTTLISRVMLILTRYFNSGEPHPAQTDSGQSKRIATVVAWMGQHFRQPITLQSAAERVYLSLPYLSRRFSQEMGMTFTCYLQQLRLNWCVEALRSRDESVARIALDAGFSHSRQLVSLCKEHYGLTPKALRDTYRKGETGELPLHEKPVRPARFTRPVPPAEILAMLDHLLPARPAARPGLRTITLPGEGYDPQPVSRLVVTIGSLAETLTLEVQQQLAQVQQEIGPFWLDCCEGVLEMPLPGVYARTEASYHMACYSEADRALSWLMRQNIPLWVRIPAACEEGQLANRIAECVNLYGAAWLEGWKFIYCPMPENQAPTLSFSRCRHALRQHLAQAKLGYWLHLPEDPNGIVCNIGHLLAPLAQAEFIGLSLYPQHQSGSHPLFTQGESWIRQRTRAVIKALAQHNISAPCFLLEWNTLTGRNHRTNGSFFRGALIHAALNALPARFEGVNLWLSLESQTLALKDPHHEITSLALFHLFGLPRPVFHVLKLRARLRGRVMMTDKHLLMIQHNEGYQLMLINSVWSDPQHSGHPAWSGQFRQTMGLMLQGLIPGEYRVKRWQFDRDHGALYGELNQNNARYWWDDETIAAVRQHTSPQLRAFDLKLGNQWRLDDVLESNALVLYELQRIAPEIPPT